MSIISICQPHFLPWIGYFNMIHLSEKFIFLDNVNYNKRSWQNRVQIRENDIDQKKWLSLQTINNSRSLKINEVKINFLSKNILRNNLKQNYSKTKYFESLSPMIFDIFDKNINNDLSKINIILIRKICEYLNISSSFSLSSQFKFTEKKEYLILKLLKENKAKIYLANAGSLIYANEDFFKKNKVKMVSHNFQHPIYDQKFNKKKRKFLDGLSILDLLFNYGKKSEEIVKSFNLNLKS